MNERAPLHPYRMAWSFRIGRIFGIDIRVHVIFLALVAWFCIDAAVQFRSLRAGGLVLLELLLLFGFVLLHELGHSLMAQRRGIRVRDITLWPLGGLARLEGYSENPRTEFLIAASGPAVNLAIAAVLWPFTWGTADVTPGYTALYADPLSVLIGWALMVNLLMGLVNLVPAFPLDGGRILRGILALRRSWFRATVIAVSVGKIIAWVVLFYSVLSGYFWIVLLCLFVLWAGSTELRVLRARQALRAAAAWGGDPGEEILEAEVVDRGYDPGDRPPPPPGTIPNLKPFEREFLEEIRRLRGENGPAP